MAQNPEILLYADSESNADMLYFGGVFVPDPFLAFSDRGKRVAMVGALEYNRLLHEGRFDEVLALEEVGAAARQALGDAIPLPAACIAHLARQRDLKQFAIAGDFPHALAMQLLELGLELNCVDGPLFAEREFKSDQEAKWIQQGNAASARGFRVVEKLLREAKIEKGYLIHNGRKLTSEAVQMAIGIACLEAGAVAGHTIVAGGDQACDPHCRGHGPLRANEFIIVDIFPRVIKTGYHGDMTRTYLKGRPTEAQKHLYATVLSAQQFAIAEHRAGKSGMKIYQAVCDRFRAANYETKKSDGQPVGFFHGLGHGLGLQVHEPPRVNPSGGLLKNGQVITVEPGLYYPGLGGVRVEDVIRVNGKVPEMLSKHPYRWHFR